MILTKDKLFSCNPAESFPANACVTFRVKLLNPTVSAAGFTPCGEIIRRSAFGTAGIGGFVAVAHPVKTNAAVKNDDKYFIIIF